MPINPMIVLELSTTINFIEENIAKKYTSRKKITKVLRQPLKKQLKRLRKNKMTQASAKPRENSDTDYKKRYDDLKKHYDTKLEEWKKEREELSTARQVASNSGVKTNEIPETLEELEEFKSKYPDVYRVVERISGMQAETHVKELKEEVETLRGREEELKVRGAYKDLLSAHPDFNN